MSTRKIEGWATEAFGGTLHYLHSTKDEHRIDQQPATLIIGGKGYTEEEVRAFIADLKDQTMSIAVEQSIDRIAAKHGIVLDPA